MYKNDENKTNNRRGFNARNSNNITTIPEQQQPRSYLARLFQPPADEVEAEAERAKLFGRQPRNINTSGSFTKE